MEILHYHHFVMCSINPDVRSFPMGPARKMYTRDRGLFRILLEGPAPDGRNQYFEVTYASAAPGEVGITLKPEIIWVRDSRVAYNVSLRKHGRNLLNIVNLETGRLVVGARS